MRSKEDDPEKQEETKKSDEEVDSLEGVEEPGCTKSCIHCLNCFKVFKVESPILRT